MPESSANLCTGLLTALRQRVHARDFLERQRQTAKDFTRQRCLPFVVVIFFLLNLVKRALQDELDEFCNLDRQAAVAARVVTKSAFCQARQKLKAEAFVELNQVQLDYFYRHFPQQTWYGFRLLAVDGSTVSLPRTPDVAAAFGLGDALPLARVSQLFDVLNQITVDALLGPTAQGEREYAAQHFAHLGPADLVLLDRGYPAFWLFALMRAHNAHFCARMPVGLWNVVDHFVATGLREQIVTLTPWAEALQECQARQLSSQPLTVRLLRIALDNGEVEVLITSLLDQVRYPYAVFKELYHQRWPVEIVFTQMTKGHLFACGRSRDDVADFHLVIIDNDAVDQQLYQLSALGEIELGECGLQAATEIFDAAGELDRVDLLLGLRLQLPQLLCQAVLRLGELLVLALELVACDHLGQVNLKQAGLLALELRQRAPQGPLTILQGLWEPLTSLGAGQFMGNEGRFSQ